MNIKLILWAIVSALAGFLFGFDTVVISGAEKTIESLWGLSPAVHGLAMGAALWGTVLGALVGSWPTDKIWSQVDSRVRWMVVYCWLDWFGSSARSRYVYDCPIPWRDRHWDFNGCCTVVHCGNLASFQPWAIGRHVSIQHRFRHFDRIPLQLLLGSTWRRLVAMDVGNYGGSIACLHHCMSIDS